MTVAAARRLEKGPGPAAGDSARARCPPARRPAGVVAGLRAPGLPAPSRAVLLRPGRRAEKPGLPVRRGPPRS